MPDTTLSFKAAAHQILKQAGKPLSAKDIAAEALKSGLIATEGQTPEATMAARIYVDMKRNSKTPFEKILAHISACVDDGCSTAHSAIVSARKKFALIVDTFARPQRSLRIWGFGFARTAREQHGRVSKEVLLRYNRHALVVTCARTSSVARVSPAEDSATTSEKPSAITAVTIPA